MRPPPLGPTDFSFFGATNPVAMSHHLLLQPARQHPIVSPHPVPLRPSPQLSPVERTGDKMAASGQGARWGSHSLATVPLAGVTHGDAMGWAGRTGQLGMVPRGPPWSPVVIPLLQPWAGRVSQGHEGEWWQRVMAQHAHVCAHRPAPPPAPRGHPCGAIGGPWGPQGRGEGTLGTPSIQGLPELEARRSGDGLGRRCCSGEVRKGVTSPHHPGVTSRHRG